jgi:hypothetical protein
MKSKVQRINEQVKRERAARRQVEIELQLPKVIGKVWDTHKRDKTTRKQVSNTVRNYDTD